MPAYNFKACFAEAVRAGTKRQTIRARGKRPPPTPGQVAHCYTGLRTRYVCLLGKFPIDSVNVISISAAQRIVSMADGSTWRHLDASEIEQLVQHDGFDNADQFFAFFQTEHGKTFSGYLIKW